MLFSNRYFSSLGDLHIFMCRFSSWPKENSCIYQVSLYFPGRKCTVCVSCQRERNNRIPRKCSWQRESKYRASAWHYLPTASSFQSASCHKMHKVCNDKLTLIWRSMISVLSFVFNTTKCCLFICGSSQLLSYFPFFVFLFLLKNNNPAPCQDMQRLWYQYVSALMEDTWQVVLEIPLYVCGILPLKLPILLALVSSSSFCFPLLDS